MRYESIKDVADFLEQEKRMERKYMFIFLGTMVVCFIVGILIGQRVGGL
jgi:hypothetical protein